MQWGILLDKAYIGVEESVRAIIPKKKPRSPGRCKYQYIS